MTNKQKIEFLHGMKIVVRNRAKISKHIFGVFGYASVLIDTGRHWLSEDKKSEILTVWSNIVSATKPFRKHELSLDTAKDFSKNIQIVINHLKTQPNEPILY